MHEAESNTSGEIRVKIINEYDQDLASCYEHRDGSRRVHEQALREFEREGMHNTRDKTGILVLVVLSEKRFTILADEGIYSKLAQEWWNHKAETMSGYFRAGNPARGICEAVKEVGKELSRYFPKKPDDVNELPDDVIVEGK